MRFCDRATMRLSVIDHLLTQGRWPDSLGGCAGPTSNGQLGVYSVEKLSGPRPGTPSEQYSAVSENFSSYSTRLSSVLNNYCSSLARLEAWRTFQQNRVVYRPSALQPDMRRNRYRRVSCSRIRPSDRARPAGSRGGLRRRDEIRATLGGKVTWARPSRE